MPLPLDPPFGRLAPSLEALASEMENLALGLMDEMERIEAKLGKGRTEVNVQRARDRFHNAWWVTQKLRSAVELKKAREAEIAKQAAQNSQELDVA